MNTEKKQTVGGDGTLLNLNMYMGRHEIYIDRGWRPYRHDLINVSRPSKTNTDHNGSERLTSFLRDFAYVQGRKWMVKAYIKLVKCLVVHADVDLNAAYKRIQNDETFHT